MNLKTTLLYLTLVCFIYGCGNMYKDEIKVSQVFIFDKDTIIVYGRSFTVDLSKIKLTNGHYHRGWWDSAANTDYNEYLYDSGHDTYINSENGTQHNNTGSGSQTIINK